VSGDIVPPAPPDDWWDVRPQLLDRNGVAVEFFRIGNVALALNRQVSTIRSLVKKGVLCHPRLKNTQQQWIYTRDQIEDLVALFTEYEVIDPKYRRAFPEALIREAHQILHRKPT
jgi:hypothetical protein